MKRFRSGWSKKGHISMQGQKDHMGLKIALLCVALLLIAGAVYYFAVHRPRQQEKIPESVDPKPFVDPALGVGSEGAEDWSNLQNEAAIRYQRPLPVWRRYRLFLDFHSQRHRAV